MNVEFVDQCTRTEVDIVNSFSTSIRSKKRGKLLYSRERAAKSFIVDDFGSQTVAAPVSEQQRFRALLEKVGQSGIDYYDLMIAYNNEYKRPKREYEIDANLLGKKTVSYAELLSRL